MSSNLVIVAIPARDEKVWKVSSEKVPHLTLLFLGENTDDVSRLERIVEFTEHAVESSEHGSFMLDVDERGTLGTDEADVLFFRKDYSLRWINQFRNQLLQQNDIRTAYDSVEQFPEWQPHLTLGYPATPANEDEIPEHGLNWITFDRIAIWTEDFDGPEFKLRWPDRETECLAYSSMNEERKALGLEALVEHHGIKGMKWGQTKDTQVTVGGKTKMVSAKKAAKLDKQFEESASSLGVKIELHNLVHDQMNQQIGRINAKPEYMKAAKDGTLRDDNHPTTKKYVQEYMDAYVKEMQTVLDNSPRRLNPSGTKKLVVKENNDLLGFTVSTEAVKHSVSDVFPFAVNFIKEANGIITDLVLEDSMAQTAELGAAFIEHHGVKGMKWGVRQHREGTLRRQAATLRTKADRAQNAKFGKQRSKDNVANRLNKKADRKEAQADHLNRNIQKTAEIRGKVVSGAKRAGRGLSGALDALGEHMYETSIYSNHTHEAIHNKVADEIDSKMYRLQSSPKYRGKNLKTDHALQTEYHQDVAKVTEVAYRRAVKDVVGENVKGTKEARYVDDAQGARIEIRDKRTGEVRRSDSLRSVQEINAAKLDETLSQAATESDTSPDITIPLKLDPNGQIKAVMRVKPKAVHTVELGIEFLEHFGVKGMKWGQRREQLKTNLHERRMSVEAANREKRPAQDVRAYPTIGPSKRSAGRVDTKGGEDHPPAHDAVKVAVARQKLKKSGVDALTNEELRDVATRLNLENQVKTLEAKSPRKSLGRQFIESQFKNKDNQQALSNFVAKSVTKAAVA